MLVLASQGMRWMRTASSKHLVCVHPSFSVPCTHSPCAQVNVLGHFLFINRLLPLLRKTHNEHNVIPRLISLTSNMHKLAPSSSTFTSLEEINDPDLRPDQ